ncbi:hypothetical protein D3C72_2045460 [compost metagenome]
MVPTTARKALLPTDRTKAFVDKRYRYDSTDQCLGNSISLFWRYSAGSAKEMTST